MKMAIAPARRRLRTEIMDPSASHRIRYGMPVTLNPMGIFNVLVEFKCYFLNNTSNPCVFDNQSHAYTIYIYLYIYIHTHITTFDERCDDLLATEGPPLSLRRIRDASRHSCAGHRNAIVDVCFKVGVVSLIHGFDYMDVLKCMTPSNADTTCRHNMSHCREFVELFFGFSGEQRRI